MVLPNRIKKQMQMKFKIAIFLWLVLGTTLVQAQYIKTRINFKASYSRYNSIAKINGEFEKVPNANVEFNYGITRFLETGSYLGFSNFDVHNYNPTDSTLSKRKSLATYYGLNINFHILPLFVHAEDFRFDLYATTKFGGRHLSNAESAVLKNEFIWAGGVGFSFYVWNKTGFFIESTYGKYNFHEAFVESFADNVNLRYGITFKFK